MSVVAIEVIPTLNDTAAGDEVVGELVRGQYAGMGEGFTPLIGVRNRVEEVLGRVDGEVTDREMK